MSLPYFLSPSRFIIQWHITERCNWHCRHCYRQEGLSIPEFDIKVLRNILGQCLALFHALRVRGHRARIDIGGGEPFLKKDLFKFLTFLDKYKDLFRVAIMTNGSFITEKTAEAIKKIRTLGSIQISLEGLCDTNDEIRGKGSFEKAIKAIRLLKKHKIHIRVSLTLTRKNLPEVKTLAFFLKEVGVNSFAIRRYVPIGRGKELEKDMLSPLELREAYYKREELKKKLDEYKKFTIVYGCEDGIFCCQDGRPFNPCAVIKGDHLNIFANGDILACRRFPIVVGNIQKKDLLNTHFSSQELYKYRDPQNLHPLCKKCSYFNLCLGGAKCVTSAYFGTPFAPDPQCWRLFKELPDQQMFSKEPQKEWRLK
ncbi:MAG: hypothetical protein AMJ95_02445 [Omnitrophica WOR_2 bacterium SM23_72]|nr:MAG: hypothetical protein AMJ95_02445 [Omnitrophica WOR_2 bacterium SM23_72]